MERKIKRKNPKIVGMVLGSQMSKIERLFKTKIYMKFCIKKCVKVRDLMKIMQSNHKSILILVHLDN